MSYITIILFFVYTFGLGFTLTSFIKKPKSILERILMQIGIGLGTLPILMVLLSFIKVPLDWRLIFILVMIVPLFFLVKKIRKLNFNLSKITISKSEIYSLVALLIFSLTLFMYLKGAFVYPYLEDDDPWSHANGVKFVSIEKTLTNKNGGTGYLDPYPPAYDGLLGILHQTSPSLMWTMKFFNALIISLSILFFYFFSYRFIGSRKKALFATSILAMIPCYLSHFIWAHSLIPPLFLIAFYLLEMIRIDKKYSIMAGLVIGSIFVTQPTQPIKFIGLFVIYFLIKLVYHRKDSLYMLFSGIGGFLLSIIWWATRWKVQLGRGAYTTTSQIEESISEGMVSNFFSIVKKALNPEGGTATRVYSFHDFFIAQSQNLINNPIGIGIMISILFLFGIIFLMFLIIRDLVKKKNQINLFSYIFGWGMLLLSIIFLFNLIIFKSLLNFASLLISLILGLLIINPAVDSKNNKGWVLITLVWILFTFLGINSLTFNLPIGLFAFRFWMLFAIPVALFSSLGAWFVIENLRKFRIKSVFVIILLLTLVFLTSGIQKYTSNTAHWPPGGFWTYIADESGNPVSPELAGYIWIKENIPINTPVFSFGKGPMNGIDMFSCNWCPEVQNYIKFGINESADNNYKWLKDNGYEYMVIDGLTIGRHGLNQTEKKLQSLVAHNRFQMLFNNNMIFIFKVL